MKLVGTSVRRVEDQRILTGRGRYVDDIQLPGMLHATFLRSPFAHARISRIDATEARAAPGVMAVFTGDDMASMTKPMHIDMPYPNLTTPTFGALATDTVRLVGDLVAVVVAESRYLAEDAAELIEVDYEPLPPVLRFEDALDPATPPIFDDMDTNVLFNNAFTYGKIDDAFDQADLVIRERFTQDRYANVPMETRGMVADYNPATDELTIHSSTQGPQMLRFHVAALVDHPLALVHVINGDVGGSFGLKWNVHREEIAIAAIAKRLARPVKWIEDRNEHLLASGHARDETIAVEVAVKTDGTLLGLRAKLVIDQGAYPCFPFPVPAMTVGWISQLLPGPYRVPAYSFDGTVVATNKCTWVPYRGPWEIETWVRERLLDVIARELGMTAVDIRRRNMVLGEEGDRTVTFLSLEDVSSRRAFERALELLDYDRLQSEHEAARAAGRCVGVGFSTFIEAAPGPASLRGGGTFGLGDEQARVSLEADGRVVVVTTQAPHGQSHETTLAQVAADEMGVPLDHVRVLHGDTRITPMSLLGTGGSRAATWASGAVLYTTRRLKEKVMAIASQMLETSVGDLEIVDGMIGPKGVELKPLSLADLAMTAALSRGMLPPGSDPELEVTDSYTGAEGITGSGWSGGTHACIVEVDIETGAVTILRYLVVEDCGRAINPAVVEGQIRGGVAQGIGGVLYERAPYDAEGQFLAGTFMDYLLPTSAEIPPIEIDHLDSGLEGEVDFRGIGEGGAIAAPAAVSNAIEDALSAHGVRIIEHQLSPARILELAGVITTSDRGTP